MSLPAVLLIVLAVIYFPCHLGTRAEDSALMHRACDQFIRGVHANRDPLDPKTGRASALFSFTYTQGHAHADQIVSVPPADAYEASTFNKVLTVWPLPNGDVETESVRKLQKFLNQTFQVDFLGPLDRALTPSLGLSQLSIFKAFTYGFTYSNEYKFERDQIEKGNNVIFKNKVQYNTFHLSLNLSSIKLSPELTSDLQSASPLSNKNRAAALVAKYGALFIKGATFGVSYTQTDYVPRPFYESMLRADKEISEEFYRTVNHRLWANGSVLQRASRFFASEDAQKGIDLLKLMRTKTSASFHRRTSLRRRGGFFSPLSFSRLPDWSISLQRPEMMKLSFGPLSHLITQPKDSELKQEVASIIRSQLLTSVAHNFLDSGLFDMQGFFPEAEHYFPDLAQFTEKTRQQMARFVAVNASALADPRVTPILKMEAIQKALDFVGQLNVFAYIGLTSAQVEVTYRSILECNQKLNHYTPETITQIQAALLEVARQGDTLFGSTFFTCFSKLWSESNDQLPEYLKNWQVKLPQMHDLLSKVVELMPRTQGRIIPFVRRCFPWAT